MFVEAKVMDSAKFLKFDQLEALLRVGGDIEGLHKLVPERICFVCLNYEFLQPYRHLIMNL